VQVIKGKSTMFYKVIPMRGKRINLTQLRIHQDFLEEMEKVYPILE